MQNPLQAHYDATLYVLRVLKENPDQRIVLRTYGDLQLTAYYDSDWESCPLIR
jgi:hypothetical protein